MKRHVTTPKAIRAYHAGKEKDKDFKVLNTNFKDESKNVEADKPIQEHDIVLDIPELKLEEVNIKARNLLAEVSMNTRLREMVTMNIGVEAHIDSLDIGMSNLRTEAHLKFRLKRVRGILHKTAHTFSKNIENLRNHNVNQSTGEQLSGSNAEELNKTELEEAIQKRVTKSSDKDE